MFAGVRVDIAVLGLVRRDNAIDRLRRVRAGLRPARFDYCSRQHSGAHSSAFVRQNIGQNRHPVRKPQTHHRRRDGDFDDRLYGGVRVCIPRERLFPSVYNLPHCYSRRNGLVPKPGSRACARCQSRPFPQYGKRGEQCGFRRADRRRYALLLRLYAFRRLLRHRRGFLSDDAHNAGFLLRNRSRKEVQVRYADRGSRSARTRQDRSGAPPSEQRDAGHLFILRRGAHLSSKNHALDVQAFTEDSLLHLPSIDTALSHQFLSKRKAERKEAKASGKRRKSVRNKAAFTRFCILAVVFCFI